MKKLIIAACACAMSVIAFAGSNIVNVYDFKMSLKTPYLKDGVRQYTGVNYTGYMYVEYTNSTILAVWAEVKSGKSKVEHYIEFNTNGFYNLMGKSSKTSARSVPTVWLQGEDTWVSGGHEIMKDLALAGSGAMKSLKVVTTTCAACGPSTTSVDYCNLLWNASGNVTGYMDCDCPDYENWSHTLLGGLCGVWTDKLGYACRSHYAATWGTWSIKYNKNLSDVEVK